LAFCAPLIFSQTRLIEADYTKVKGPHNTFFREVVGAGRAAEGLRADWQRDLAIVHRECGFKYIRFHGLLQDELGVYREDRQGHPVYNFQYIDALYDAILNTGMKPFVEFGFMPRGLASGNKTIFWWNGNVTPPKDYDKWGALIRALVQHWTERYGTEEVKQWYFEVWNEPNLDGFWSGTQAEYFKLYATTVRVIKNVSNQYRVGGPATAGNAWIPETIEFASKNNLPLDFITTHDYGVRGIGLDEHGEQKLQLITDSGAIIDNVRSSRANIVKSVWPTLPLHYTEWSTSYSPRDPVHDSYVSAAYILAKLKGTEGYADSMSYWTFTDIFEEPGPVVSPFHGGFGLMNFQGLRKPSFYAYQFLNRLGETELISSDKESWVCKTVNGVQILLWNFTPPKTDESNQKFYPRDVSAKEAGPLRVSVKGLPAGTYTQRIYRVGYQINDVYADYLKLGSPANLTREQVTELAQKNDGRAVSTTRVTVGRDKSFQFNGSLRENDVYLITLEKK
jgi:xylan 1,4-beta-xylosidase